VLSILAVAGAAALVSHTGSQPTATVVSAGIGAFASSPVFMLSASTNNTTSNTTSSVPWYDQAWSDISNAASSAYQYVVGGITSDLTNGYNSFVSSASNFIGKLNVVNDIENAIYTFFEDGISAILAFISFLGAEILSIFNDMLLGAVGLSYSMGIFGPTVAIITIVAIFLIIYLVLSTIEKFL